MQHRIITFCVLLSKLKKIMYFSSKVADFLTWASASLSTFQTVSLDIGGSLDAWLSGSNLKEVKWQEKSELCHIM